MLNYGCVSRFMGPPGILKQVLIEVYNNKIYIISPRYTYRINDAVFNYKYYNDWVNIECLYVFDVINIHSMYLYRS